MNKKIINPAKEAINKAPKVTTMRMAYDSSCDILENLYGEYCDYVRYREIELLAEELRRNKVEGSIAEIGVDFGDTSVILNNIFFDRKLLLYDTFDGFDEKDIIVENKLYHKELEFFEKWKNKRVNKETLIQYIKSRLPYPEKVIIREGYFSDTANEYDSKEKFALAILDVDLYKPTLAGLRFIYPRLAHKGYILIHDYNTPFFDGIHDAVDEFIKENEVGCAIPIPDQGGTIIISKP